MTALLCEYGEAPPGYAGPMHWCHVHRQWHPWRAEEVR